MRFKDEKKIILRKEFPNGNYAVREFITQRKGRDVHIIRSIESMNGNRKRTVREFNVNKDYGNMAFENNLKQGFKVIK